MYNILTKEQAFVDETGRERIFNGLNFVYKGCEKDDDGVIRYHTDICDELLKKLVAQGINVIRLGVTWAGIEPEPQKYNTAYLDGVKDTLLLCQKYGVYAFVDWHQDLYSFYAYYWGDGAPEWACVRPAKIKKYKLIWAEGYFFGKGVHRSFDAFWNNADYNGKGLQERYCDMLKYTVKYLNDSGVKVMGWDVMNEPFPGTVGGKIFRTLVANGVMTVAVSKRIDRSKLMFDAINGRVMDMLSVADDKIVYHGVIDAANKMLYEFDTQKYYPFLKRAASAIREAGSNAIIFAENCYYSNLGIPCSTPHIVYDNGKPEENMAFSPHGYDLTVDSPLTNEASPYRVDHIFDEHERTQQRMDVPVLVGEWGGMVPGSTKYPALKHLVDKFDKNKWSNTYWHYIKDMENGMKIMSILARSYPMAVAGKIKSYGTSKDESSFHLSYTGSSKIKTPTLIYLNREPVKIYSTKEYTLKTTDGARILQVNAGEGECVVKVEF